MAEAEPIRRPDPLHWVWYAFGGRLPDRNRGWILYDATARTWAWRHVARTLTQLAIPVLLVIFVVPGPLGIRLPAAIAGSLMGLFFSLAYSSETIEHRTRRAGYAPGLPEAIRQRAAQDRDAHRAAQRHARHG